MGNTPAILFALFTLSTAAWGDYTGDYKVTTSGGRQGGHNITGKVMAKLAAKKMRMNVEGPGGMGNVSIIIDETNRKIFNIMHSRRTIMEMDMALWERENNSPCMNAADAEACLTRMGFRKTGTESANGYDCDVFTKSETRDGVATTTKFYHPKNRADAPLTRMIMTRPDNTMQMDITNISYNAVADSTFALPSGYARQDASAMMNAYTGGGKGGAGGKAPSAADMERMQKMIQEQMRKRGH
jgi:hypothetical protein